MTDTSITGERFRSLDLCGSRSILRGERLISTLPAPHVHLDDVALPRVADVVLRVSAGNRDRGRSTEMVVLRCVFFIDRASNYQIWLIRRGPGTYPPNLLKPKPLRARRECALELFLE